MIKKAYPPKNTHQNFPTKPPILYWTRGKKWNQWNLFNGFIDERNLAVSHGTLLICDSKIDLTFEVNNVVEACLWQPAITMKLIRQPIPPCNPPQIYSIGNHMTSKDRRVCPRSFFLFPSIDENEIFFLIIVEGLIVWKLKNDWHF